MAKFDFFYSIFSPILVFYSRIIIIKTDASKSGRNKMEEEKKQTTEVNVNVEEKSDGQKDAQTDGGTPIKKKINQMTLNEIETKMKELEETQGGLSSKYAKHLIARKNSLKS
jgi:hypothetical protein